MKNELSKEEQKAYLYGKIGDPVNFKYPEPPYLLKGKLLDRYATFDAEDEWVVYWSMIDLIRFEGEEEDWLRITYYRYKKKERRWIFAGQTSLANPVSGFLELFVKAIKEKRCSLVFITRHIVLGCLRYLLCSEFSSLSLRQ